MANCTEVVANDRARDPPMPYVMKNLTLYIDITFCIIVLPVMIMLFPVERWFHNFRWYVLSFGIWLYLFYFLNRWVTVPSLFRDGRRPVAGVVLAVMSLAVTFAFSQVSLYTPKPNIHDIGIDRLLLPNVLQYRQAVWTLFMIVTVFSFAVGLLTQTHLQRARRRDVEQQRDRALIDLYRSRIKPHFMFNTLNSLYGLFLTSDSRALPSLEKFISMMRYVNTSAASDCVPLADEIDYLRRYIDLQRLRLSDTTSVSLDIDVSNCSLNVPPMLLVTFVENCFKHGVSSVEPCRVEITVSEHDGTLRFTTSNRIFTCQKAGDHLGISNCRNRLQILYPHRHNLGITRRDGYFYVDLTIELSE